MFQSINIVSRSIWTTYWYKLLLIAFYLLEVISRVLRKVGNELWVQSLTNHFRLTSFIPCLLEVEVYCPSSEPPKYEILDERNWWVLFFFSFFASFIFKASNFCLLDQQGNKQSDHQTLYMQSTYQPFQIEKRYIPHMQLEVERLVSSKRSYHACIGDLCIYLNTGPGFCDS